MKKTVFRMSLKRLIPLLLAAMLLLSSAAFAEDTAAGGDRDMDYLKSIMDMITEQYKGQVTESQLIQGAVNGMLNSLDPYTTFFTPAEADSFMSTMNGTFSGIGVLLESIGEYIVVTKVFTASPAERVGIIQGDKIVEADGKSLIGKSTEEAVSLISGEAGTRVRLGVLRNNDQDMRYFGIIRETIKINPIQYEIRDGIGYIKLDIFNENTEQFLNNALDEMDKNNVTGLVLDLRDNPGGEVGQAVAVARKFVPSGIITTLDYKSEAHSDIEYRSYLDKPKYKLAVLVNGASASASEIVAGAVQDTAAGKLIGTKTFGKAKFQGIIPILTTEAFAKYERQLGAKLVDAYELINKYQVSPLQSEISGYAKITLGLYYTPGGRMIDGIGLMPDYAVEDPKPVNDVNIVSVQKLTRTVKPGLNGQGIDVYNAEKILKLMGCDIDAPDTTLDDRTFGALKEFQRSSGLWPYGELDFATQKALNDMLDKLILQTDKQYAKAVEILKQ